MKSTLGFCLLFALAASGVGCAAIGSPGQTRVAVNQSEFANDDAVPAAASITSPASALVFDLPIAQDIPPFMLDRSLREPTAFLGYDEPTIEYRTTLIDNSQNSASGGSSFWGLGYGATGDSYSHEDVIRRESVRYH